MPIHSSGQTVFSLSHIEGITLSAGEEVDEVAGGAGGMGVEKWRYCWWLLGLMWTDVRKSDLSTKMSISRKVTSKGEFFVHPRCLSQSEESKYIFSVRVSSFFTYWYVVHASALSFPHKQHSVPITAEDAQCLAKWPSCKFTSCSCC